MGELEEGVDYRELLRSKGIEVPATEAEGSSMGDEAEGIIEEGSYIDEEASDEDIQVGTPLQGSTIGDVDPRVVPSGSESFRMVPSGGGVVVASGSVRDRIIY